MRKFGKLVLVAALATLVRTASPVFAKGSAQGGGGVVSVGLALTGMKSNPIFIDIMHAFEDYCSEHNYRLIAADLSNGAPDMVKFLENCITAKAKIVVFQNIAEDAYVNLLRELKTQGCILGSYDNPSNIADYSISASNYELGKVIGSMCGEWTHNNPGSKKVALAKFDQMDIMIERARGMRDGFKEKCPEGTIAYDQDININDMGYSFGEALVTSAPDIQSVMAITDGPCISVEQAFAAAGWTWDNHKIGLFGSDASVDGMRELRAGGMFKGTVYMDLVTQVTSLFRRCLNAMETGKVDASQKLVYFTMIPVTLQNADIVK